MSSYTDTQATDGIENPALGDIAVLFVHVKEDSLLTELASRTKF